MKSPKIAESTEQLTKISVAKLSELSGFERSWLSRLSVRGYFPPSENGVYDHDAALAGLFRYWKESKSRLIKLKEKKLENDIKKQEIEIAQMNGLYFPKEKVKADLFAIGLGIRGLFQKVLENEWPAKAVGKSQIELIELGRQTTGRICDEFNDKTHQWTQ